MKKLILTLTLCLSYFISNAQNEMSYEAVTYINNVSSEEVPRFIELHKKFTDMGVGKNRKATGEWLFRHWYGSGHTFVMYDQYNAPNNRAIIYKALEFFISESSNSNRQKMD